ncbi:MAG: hypothetical protein V4850_26885 [Myxococcota bacterium]
MSWGRSIGAVVAGFLATAVLSIGTDAVMHATGVFPPLGVRMPDAMFVLPAVYRAAFTVVGGWVTARLAPHAPMRHAWALAALGTLGGLAGLAAGVAGGDALGPLWYAVSIPVSAIPCILAGAWLATRRRVSVAAA